MRNMIILLGVLILVVSNVQADAAQLQCLVQSGGCDEILPVHSGTHYRLVNRSDLAGKTICIPAGTTKGLAVEDVIGAAGNPVTITNCGGQVIFDSSGWSNGISILRSQYIHLTGSGDDALTYGFVQKNANSMGLDADLGTSDIEIDHLEVFDNGYAGIVVRTYPRCGDKYNRNTWTLENVHLHHNYVHDVDGEGFYIGTSHFSEGEREVDSENCKHEMAAQSELKHIKIHHNRVENIGRDGIQLGAGVEDIAVYNNIIKYYAKNQEYAHVGGLQINSGTTGKFYNNWIESGPFDLSGTAIQYVGGIGGPTDIYNNIIIGSPTAILTLGHMGGADTPLNIIHNTVVNSGSPYYFFCHSDSFTMAYTIKNNIFAGFDHIGDQLGGGWSKIFNSHASNCPINGQVYDTSNIPDAFVFVSNTSAENIADTDFVHAASNNLYLQATSPAVGAGEDFLASFPTDFDGNTRNLPADNGAYIYSSATDIKKTSIFLLIKAGIEQNASK